MSEEIGFTITWDGCAYKVSIPNYKGGVVYPQSVVDDLRERLTAAEKREKYAITWANRSLDSVKEADDAIIAGLKKALELIAGHKGKTIYSHDPEYRQGAHDAYEQLADIARAALATPGVSDGAKDRQKTLTDFVIEHWDNQDMNHADFRVRAFQITQADTDAIAGSGE